MNSNQHNKNFQNMNGHQQVNGRRQNPAVYNNQNSKANSFIKQRHKYKPPKNLCQQCYQKSGRYILDCYCIICQQCYRTHPQNLSLYTCPLCGRETKGNKIDAKQETSIKKIGHLFQNVDTGLQRMLQVYKFQNQIVNRYCYFLQKQLDKYKKAVGQAIVTYPALFSFFNSRIKLSSSHQIGGQANGMDRNTQKIQQPMPNKAHINSHNHNLNYSVKGDNTVKYKKQYGSQILESKRSTLDYNFDNSLKVQHNQIRQNQQYNRNSNMLMPPIISSSNRNSQIPGMADIRPIGRSNNNHNYSGNIVYKVPNINYNTAVRSSKRITSKGGSKYEQEKDNSQLNYGRAKPDQYSNSYYSANKKY